MDAISRALDAAQKSLPEIQCRQNEPMKDHTSFKIGGPVRAMFFPKSAKELTDLCEALYKSGVKPLIIGNGTNLLADDAELDFIAVKTTGVDDVTLTNATEITAGCGILLSKLAVFAQQHGLAGLEFAHGIPGTLGGAILMNAGAYGGEIKDIVCDTTVFCPENGVVSITGAEHEFSYRQSRFLNTDEVILSSVLRLTKANPAYIRSKMDELSMRRREAQPLNLPSAGSAFKRPKDGYAAKLIDDAGLKGFTVGGAQVSEKHAGFIVNHDGATFADVMAVAGHVREAVQKQFGIELELEMRIIRGKGS